MGSYGQNNSEVTNIELEDDNFISAIHHFHAGVCSNCYAIETTERKLSRCGQCHLLSYCSKSCQKMDWEAHRPLCVVNKVIDSQNVFDSAIVLLRESEKSNWFDIRKNISIAASVNIRRPLTVKESDLFMFPKVCEVCKETKVLTSASCFKCHSAFYCSEQHKALDENNHQKWCEHLLLCLECDSYEALHGVKDLPFPTDIDTSYSKLPGDLMALLNPQLRVDPDKTLDHRFVAMIGERLSYPCSLLYALEKVGVGTDKKLIEAVSDLKIHVIGAKSSTELLGIIRWEYLLHRLPFLQRFHIIFIGPDLLSYNSDEEDELIDNHCIESSGITRCIDCNNKGRLVIYEMATMLYHEYVESVHYSLPDAIIAFNCGFHEHMDQKNDTWAKTLKLITQSCVPLIYTSYTKEESEKDLEAIQKVNMTVKVEIPGHDNPFKAARPMRCPEGEDGNKIFFYNQYLTSIRGSSKDAV